MQIWAALLSLLLPSIAFGLQDCKLSMRPLEVCDLDLQELRPTQLHLGIRQVQAMAKELKDKDGDSYDRYLRKNPVPVVIGLQGYYMIDHHHLTRSVYEIGKHKMVIVIKQNWSNLSVTEFWNKMSAEQYTWLRDAQGAPISYQRFQRYSWAMTDDPYRSLAGYAREAGAFTKSDTSYFIEFKWALFFRQNLKDVDLSSNSGFKEAVKRAVKLAHSPAASHMPGYLPK